jgi:hypothetical protein
LLAASSSSIPSTGWCTANSLRISSRRQGRCVSTVSPTTCRRTSTQSLSSSSRLSWTVLCTPYCKNTTSSSAPSLVSPSVSSSLPCLCFTRECCSILFIKQDRVTHTRFVMLVLLMASISETTSTWNYATPAPRDVCGSGGILLIVNFELAHPRCILPAPRDLGSMYDRMNDMDDIGADYWELMEMIESAVENWKSKILNLLHES